MRYVFVRILIGNLQSYFSACTNALLSLIEVAHGNEAFLTSTRVATGFGA